MDKRFLHSFASVASRKLRKRVPALVKVGAQGSRSDQKSSRLCPQASASVRKRLQAFAECRAWESKIVAKGRNVITLGSSRLTRGNSHGDWEGRGRETQNCRYFWTCIASIFIFASPKCVRGVVVAKRRTGVTFGLALRLRISAMSTITGIAGGRGREAQNCRHVWTCCVGGVVVAKRRTVVTFGPVASSRLNSVNNHGDSGVAMGRGRETQNCRHFWTCVASIFASQKCQQSYGSGGSWPRNADLSSL